MKILVLGDIHGRTVWKDIIEKEQPDKTIFLGDYVSTHHLITEEQQIENLKEILEYKDWYPDNVVLLRGNHDLQHLGYYWAECSGYFRKVAEWMFEHRHQFLASTQWIHIDEELKTIFSHAGISEIWLNRNVADHLKRSSEGTQYNDGTFDVEVLLNHINDMEPSEHFSFIPSNMFDMYGDSVTQPCVWIRPTSLAKCMVEGYTQVVGHTPVKLECTDAYKSTVKNQHLWLCDALHNRNYLVIEDGEFKHRGLL